MKLLFTLLGLAVPMMPVLAQVFTEGNRPTGAPFATRSPVMARHGMAATSHPLASQVAIDVLKQGGNAVDAAIAANATLGLMEPTGCGVGGDLFALVWDPKTARLYGLNASGRAPQGLTLEMLRTRVQALGADAIPYWGPLPVSVPGAVDGWFTLHGRFGHLPMSDVLAPAIRYAHEGFPVTPVIAAGWAANLRRFEQVQHLIGDDNWRRTYLLDGRAPQEGAVFRNPDLARTYEHLARVGRDGFYKGTLADVMEAYMRRVGGYLRKEDLAAHTSMWVEPLHTTYRGYQVYELPPNGQGLSVLQMLNLLESWDLKAAGFGSADHLHLMAEAKKVAFEDRARFYADPTFADVPVAELLSDAYTAERRALIRRDQALQTVAHGDPERLRAGDTIYLTVADSTGMMVSLIQSNYQGLGSGLVPDGLGFMFQDRGAGFTLTEGHPNVYAPGKRPFHTIIPAFVTRDGVPFLSFGVMGGDMQPQGHVQILVNLLDFRMNVQEAGDAPRWRHDGSSSPFGGAPMTDGGTLHLEHGFSPAAIADLERRGHRVRIGQGDYGGYQAILWDPVHRVYHGASEMRKDGQVVGY
jgi:gamma-glutamyltranspeptidase/glutathione hydrolase